MNAEKGTATRLRRTIFSFLKSPHFDKALDELRLLPGHRTISILLSFLCHTDQEVKWHAVTATGLMAAKLAEANMESARGIMRRLMWSLNDESGSIGWGAPEAMGEIMACHEGLAEEYVHILISYFSEEGNFLGNASLLRGAVWSLGRLAQARPHVVKDAIINLYPFLESRDPVLRGLASWIMGLLGAEEARGRLQNLVVDSVEVQLFLDSRLVVCTVSDLAGQALAALHAVKTTRVEKKA